MHSSIPEPPRPYKLVDTSAGLSAVIASSLLHLSVWLIWQNLPEPPPKIEPPKVIEVALNAPTPSQPKTAAPIPAQPIVPPKPAPAPAKKVEPPKAKPKPEKPKPTPKPKPTAQVKPKPTPTPVSKPAVEAPPVFKPFEPTPLATSANTSSTKASKPAPAASAPTANAEPMVKAVYSSASLHNPPTHYPRLAQTRGWEGTVHLLVKVLTNGSAGEIKVVQSSGHDILDESAVEQVKSWRFLPAHKGKQVIEDWVKVPIAFKFKH